MSAAIVAAVVGVGGSAILQNQAKKAAQGAASASQVDISALDAKTREIAHRNAIESAELERLLTPEVANTRTQAMQGVSAGLNEDPSTVAARNFLMGKIGQTGMSP